MEIKIECACGTRYKFEVEPVNNQMPVPVQCPSCGVDGTGNANQLIAQRLAAPPAPMAPAPATVPPIRLSFGGAPPVKTTPPAPPPSVASPSPAVRISLGSSAASPTPPPPAPPMPSMRINVGGSTSPSASSSAPRFPQPVRLKLGGQAPSESPPVQSAVDEVKPMAATAPTPPMPRSVAHPVPAPDSPRATPAPLASSPGHKKKRGDGPNLMLGTVGAVAASLLGMVIWYLIIKATHTEYGIIAWGLGVLTGYGCRLLGAGANLKLGFVSGACAFVAIIGGEYLATKATFDEFTNLFLDSAYQAQVEFAKEAVQKTTDEEIRTLLAERNSDEDNKVTADSISSQDLEKFRLDELPKLKDLAEGKTTKAAFQAKVRAEFNSAGTQAEVFKDSFSLWTLLWLFLGVGSAFKLGSGQA